MKVLVLSGEIDRSQPISYCLPTESEIKVVSVFDDEINALIEKYDSVYHIPVNEVTSYIQGAHRRAVSILKQYDATAVVGVGLGAHVLYNLIETGNWSGPAVLVKPAGFFKGTVASRDVDSTGGSARSVAWILGKSTASKCDLSLKKTDLFRRSENIINVADDKLEAIYSSGLLASVISLLH